MNRSSRQTRTVCLDLVLRQQRLARHGQIKFRLFVYLRTIVETFVDEACKEAIAAGEPAVRLSEPPYDRFKEKFKRVENCLPESITENLVLCRIEQGSSLTEEEWFGSFSCIENRELILDEKIAAKMNHDKKLAVRNRSRSEAADGSKRALKEG